MMKIKLFGKNVMLRQEKKSVVRLHLPEEMKKDGPLFDIVVVDVGDEVTRVKPGDVVIAVMPQSCAHFNPATGDLVMVVQEDMVLGVACKSLA